MRSTLRFLAFAALALASFLGLLWLLSRMGQIVGVPGVR